MKRHSIETIGFTVCDSDEDALRRSHDELPRHLGMSDLLALVDVDPLHGVCAGAFETADLSPTGVTIADGYRANSGRPCPPVYRVRIVVEAEPLSDAESLAWWETRRGR